MHIDNVMDWFLNGKSSLVNKALHRAKNDLEFEHSRNIDRGAKVNRIELCWPTARNVMTYEVDVALGDRIRPFKLQVREADDRRNPASVERGARDLSKVTIFIRAFDNFGQILRRIKNRINLIIADLRREIIHFKRAGLVDIPPTKAYKEWRRIRRHWCLRPRFMPCMAF